ncbi:PTS sugar transporter subunit IIA [Clostridium beijerinckii]|jgi:PTS system, glucose subfamily, IIA component|uniref:PTS glucose transporter subunit IIA n=2 Tax=Clostridium beijerinckii TaxID=1520 RepID=A0AAE2RN46_CLOBE|nr:PTS glucose transporter subunit IIA [Clostridium beijerinckii]ABR36911.1 PTS system, glucose subfamily, IIA subunit [Clostridium beijerinckii NCIMB 8052]AIU04544.1 PTS system, glucose subfamily, IIA subunit [Clostridium beijerinckii ATCC 35702]MBF7808442.1 PTS glucose transporter subunit IIA [Clostridium beijerinckii]NRT22011.1 PTS system glucose-specific IIA component [Clostridium beijerinckii]NRT65482.1 PTS system glucose-specific IIA component [Clostridium beijerinckii]
MFKNILKRNKNKLLYAFTDGVSVDISEVKDEVFSQKMMGEGIAIKPSSNKIFSPCDGTIVTIMKESKHAIGIRTEDGVEILIHVGLDTVNLKGEGFNLYCEEEKYVKKGELLLEFDKELLKEKGIEDITMLIIPNLNGHEILNFHIGEIMKVKESPIIEYK